MLFDNTIETSIKHKNKLLKPITLKLNQLLAMDKVVSFLNENDISIGEISESFHEIYAYSDSEEFTFTFIQDDGKTILSIVLFSERYRFSKKKRLIKLVEKLRKYFNDYRF